MKRLTKFIMVVLLLAVTIAALWGQSAEQKRMQWLRSKELIPANISEIYKSEMITTLTESFNSLGEYKTKYLLDSKDEQYYFNDNTKASPVTGEDYITLASVSVTGYHPLTVDVYNPDNGGSKQGNFRNYGWISLKVNGGHINYTKDTSRIERLLSVVFVPLTSLSKRRRSTHYSINEKLIIEKRLISNSIFLTTPTFTTSATGRNHWNDWPAWWKDDWERVGVTGKEMYFAKEPKLSISFSPYEKRFKAVNFSTENKVKVISAKLYDATGQLVFNKVAQLEGVDCIRRLNILPTDLLVDNINNLEGLKDGKYSLVVGIIDKFNKIYVYKPESITIDSTPPVVSIPPEAIKPGKLYNEVRYLDKNAPTIFEWTSISDDISGYDNPADHIFIKLKGDYKFYQATSQEFPGRGLFAYDNNRLSLVRQGENITIEEMFIADKAGNRAQFPKSGAAGEESYLIGGTKGSYTYFLDQGAPGVYYNTISGDSKLDYYGETAIWSGLANKVKEQSRCYYIDTNNDNFLDLLYANENGGLSIYLNNKTGGFHVNPSWSGLTELGQISKPGFIFIDMNKDNKEDLVRIDTALEKAFIYLNNSNGTFSNTANWNIYIGNGKYTGVIYNTFKSIFETIPDSDKYLYVRYGLGNGVMHFPYIEDIDLDGVPDFIQFDIEKFTFADGSHIEELIMNVSYGASSNNQSITYSFTENIGGPKVDAFTAYTQELDLDKFEKNKYYLNSIPVFFDYNNDGKKDILFYNNYNKRFYIAVNENGSYNLSDGYLVHDSDKFNLLNYKVMDLNSNGMDDLIVEAQYKSPPTETGTVGVTTNKYEIMFDQKSTNSPNIFNNAYWEKTIQSSYTLENDQFLDINNDGYLDWINISDTFKIYLNNRYYGFSSALLWSNQALAGSNANEFGFVDIDNGGSNEIVRVTNTGGIDIFKSVVQTFNTSDTLLFKVDEISKLVKINKLSLIGLDKDGKMNGSRNIIPFNIPLELPRDFFETTISTFSPEELTFMKNVAYKFSDVKGNYTLDLKMSEVNEQKMRRLFFDSGYISYKDVTDIKVPLEVLRGENEGEYLLYCEVEDVLGGINKIKEFYFKVTNNLPPTQINIALKGQTPINPTQVEEYNGDCLVDVVVDDTLFKSFDLDVVSSYAGSSNRKTVKNITKSQTTFPLVKDLNVIGAYEELTITVTSYDRYDNKYTSTKVVRLYNDNTAPTITLTQSSSNSSLHEVKISDDTEGTVSAYKVVNLTEGNMIPYSEISTVPSYRSGQWQGALNWTIGSATPYNVTFLQGQGVVVYSCDRWGNDNSGALSTTQLNKDPNYNIVINTAAHWEAYKNQILSGKIYIDYDIVLNSTDHLQIAGDAINPTKVYINSSKGLTNTAGGNISLDTGNGDISFIGVGSDRWAGIKVGANSSLNFTPTGKVIFKNAKAGLIFEDPVTATTLSNLTFTNCLIGIHWLDSGGAYDMLTVNNSTFTDCVYGIKLDLTSGSYLPTNSYNSYLTIESASCNFSNMSRVMFYWNGKDYSSY